MPGRLRTGSRPLRTSIASALYCCWLITTAGLRNGSEKLGHSLGIHAERSTVDLCCCVAASLSGCFHDRGGGKAANLKPLPGPAPHPEHHARRGEHLSNHHIRCRLADPHLQLQRRLLPLDVTQADTVAGRGPLPQGNDDQLFVGKATRPVTPGALVLPLQPSSLSSSRDELTGATPGPVSPQWADWVSWRTWGWACTLWGLLTLQPASRLSTNAAAVDRVNNWLMVSSWLKSGCRSPRPRHPSGGNPETRAGEAHPAMPPKWLAGKNWWSAAGPTGSALPGW